MLRFAFIQRTAEYSHDLLTLVKIYFNNLVLLIFKLKKI